MNVRSVSALPVLDQSQFPALPVLRDEVAMLHASDSRLGRYEPEVVLSVLTMAAVRNNGWRPVSMHEFLMIAHNGVPAFLFQGVVSAIWELVEKNSIQMVRFEGSLYIVPTAPFAAALDNSKLRYLPAVS